MTSDSDPITRIRAKVRIFQRLIFKAMLTFVHQLTQPTQLERDENAFFDAIFHQNWVRDSNRGRRTVHKAIKAQHSPEEHE